MKDQDTPDQVEKIKDLTDSRVLLEEIYVRFSSPRSLKDHYLMIGMSLWDQTSARVLKKLPKSHQRSQHGPLVCSYFWLPLWLFSCTPTLLTIKRFTQVQWHKKKLRSFKIQTSHAKEVKMWLMRKMKTTRGALGSKMRYFVRKMALAMTKEIWFVTKDSKGTTMFAWKILRQREKQPKYWLILNEFSRIVWDLTNATMGNTILPLSLLKSWSM